MPSSTPPALTDRPAPRSAQPAVDPSPHGFHHVALSVRDCDSSARWYTNVLGLEEVFREDSPHRRVCVMRLPAGPGSVGVVEHIPNAREPFDPRCRGLDHLAFTVESLNELHRWVDRLTSAQVAHSGVLPTPRGGIVNFKDPDGIALAFFCDAPSPSPDPATGP